MFQPPSGARSPAPPRRSRSLIPILSLCVLLVLGAAAPLLRAQDEPTPDDLAQRLAEALARIDQLEGRVAELEGQAGPEDDLEAQLQSLIVEEPEKPPPRTSFLSAYNPSIGVFMDATVDAGNAQEKLGVNGDRFSLRETEIDLRAPLSPFATGVLVTTFEDAGSGAFDVGVEEGYADVALGALLDTDTVAQAKVGRFRVPFGHDNVLHTHDQLQVDRSIPVTKLLGNEGLIGDGIQVSSPVHYSEDEDGLGATTSVAAALVNGEMLTGDEGLLGERAADAGLTLNSDAPMVVGRVSHYKELSTISDLELGASVIKGLNSRAVMTDAPSRIEPTFYSVDATWRHRDDETGVGGWLLTGEAITSHTDFGQPGVAGFPSGGMTARGWSLTAQRQTDINTFIGLRVGRSDQIGTDDTFNDVSPYISWYADEFFRLRVQGQRLQRHAAGPGDATAYRLLLEATWNFGTHLPHPYWVNR